MRDTRQKILKAAKRLFYADGIRAVGVDAIAAKAGITKKTLYYHFKSKDDIITEYLVERDHPNLSAFKKWFSEYEGSLSDKVGAIFDGLARACQHPEWRGCGFLRTIAELANMPGHPAVKVGANHKKRVEYWIGSEIDLILLDPSLSKALARQIAILIDGAFSAMLTHRDASYIESAGTAARHLIDAALRDRQSADERPRSG